MCGTSVNINPAVETRIVVAYSLLDGVHPRSSDATSSGRFMNASESSESYTRKGKHIMQHMRELVYHRSRGGKLQHNMAGDPSSYMLASMAS